MKRIDPITLLVSAGLVLLALLMISRAEAQETRPDVPLLLVDGKGPMKCVAPSDSDMAQVCFVRTDVTPLIELGCVPAGPDEPVLLELTVPVTAGDDGEVRCYAVDTSGLVGDFSLNAGLADFSPPGRPYVE